MSKNNITYLTSNFNASELIHKQEWNSLIISIKDWINTQQEP